MAAGRGGNANGRLSGRMQPPVATPDGWPAPADVAASWDFQAAAKRAACAITPEHVLKLLKEIPDGPRRSILRGLGLRSAATVNLGMAGAGQARIAADPFGDFASDLLAPAVAFFELVDFTPAEWRSAVSDDPRAALEVMTASESRFQLLLSYPIGIDQVFHPLILVQAVAKSAPCSAIALAMLARTDRAAEDAYAALASANSTLPERADVDLDGIRMDRRIESAGIELANDAVSRLDLVEALAEGESRSVPEDTLAAFQESNEEEDEAMWREAAATAQDIATVLHDGRLPERVHIDSLNVFVDWVEHRTEALSTELGVPVARDLRSLVAARDELRRRAEEAGEQWLRELDNLVLVTEIADLGALLDRLKATVAGHGDRSVDIPEPLHSGVLALIDIVRLARERHGGAGFLTELFEAKSRARSGLPGFEMLIDAAGEGILQSAAPTATGPRAETPAEELSEESVAEPAFESAEAQEAAPAEPEPEEIDLSDLDELLRAESVAEQPAASLSKHAAPRPARTQPVEQASDPAVELAPTGSDAPAVTTADVDLAEPALLEAFRFGLAADLREASGAPEAVVAARRLAAYADRLRWPDGAIATEFAAGATKMDAAFSSGDHTGGLLAWAAAVRAAIVAPSAGAAVVIGNLEHRLSTYPSLVALGQAFADASKAGVTVVARSEESVAELREAERAAGELAQIARDLLDKAATRTIKYLPATPVYRQWMQPGGVLGRLLTSVAADDHDAVAQVREQLIGLWGHANQQIDDTFRQIRNQKNRQKIIAGARQTLQRLFNDALETAKSWTEHASTIVEAQNTADTPEDWQAAPLMRLRVAVSSLRRDVEADINRMAGSDDAGVAAALRMLVEEAVDVADGKPPMDAEQAPEFAVHKELLAADLALDAGSLVPVTGLTGDCLGALLAVASRPEQDPAALYEFRAGRGDHDLTQVLIDAVARSDGPGADNLTERRSESVRGFARWISADIEMTGKAVNTSRMNGTLDEETWSLLTEAVEVLARPERRDFGTIRTTLTGLAQNLEEHRAARIIACQARIRARAAEDSRVAQVEERLVGMAGAGNVASADEIIEQILAGEDEPLNQVLAGDGGLSTDEEADHFGVFFPAVPRLMAGSSMTEELRAVLDGAAPQSEGCRAFVDTVGIDLASLSDSRRQDGVKALNAWQELRRTTPRIPVPELLRDVLAEAGLEFSNITQVPRQKNTPGRDWVNLSGVRGTGQALTPVLGSGMGPSGSTLRVLLVRSAASPATLIEWMAGEPANETVLALWLDEPLSVADRRKIADAARGRRQPAVIVLDEAVLAYLVFQAEPRRSTLAALGLPFTAASPYSLAAGSTPPEMFYGRTEELAAVKDMEGPSIFYGGRQLGKSALLRTAERQENEGQHSRAVLVDIFHIGGEHPERIWTELWPRLAKAKIVPEVMPDGDPASVITKAVQNWLEERPRRTLLIMFDEADNFLEADARGNRFTNVHRCRDLMMSSQRRVKVVFAGLHQTGRFETMMNQPLAHLGTPVLVGPLKSPAARNLLIRPLRALGYRFEDPVATPARILGFTNNMPAMLQLFGAALMDRLSTKPVGDDEPPGVITDPDVEAVLSDTELVKKLREKYVLTLYLDPRYQMIAYQVAYAAYDRDSDNSLTLRELHDRCRASWPAGFADVRLDEFRALVDECKDLGVLAADVNGYRMRTPTVQRMLGTEDEIVEFLAEAGERLDVPSPGDIASYRHRLDDGSRVPLTERQLADLFGMRSKALFITGSPALGISQVIESVLRMSANRQIHVERVAAATAQSIRRAAARLPEGRCLLLGDLRESSLANAASALEEARSIVGRSREPLTVALVATSTTAPVWSAYDNRVDLGRVDRPGLRLWCNEEHGPYQHNAAQDTLLTETGGWPALVAARLADHANGGRRETSPADLVGAAGLDGGSGVVASALASVFDGVRQVSGSTPENVEDLAFILAEHHEDVVKAAGFGDIRDVLETLLALGALVENGSDGVLPEPVLLRAFGEAREQ